jgi:formylglycine-generating enzyme required for sulfatase activity
MKLKLGLFLVLLMAIRVIPAWAEPAAGAKWVEPKTGMEFVWVPTGCFNMGGDNEYEQPFHRVCLKGFWMGKYEVTQGQYQSMMKVNPSNFSGKNNPVERVNLDDAYNFVDEMSYLTGTKVKLPSEAEWEYACRAGSAHERFCGGGGKPERVGWYKWNSQRSTHPVGQLAANDWGLYDMSGNVWEWTHDCWNENYEGAPTDGSAWRAANCTGHVLRGGSWLSYQNTLNAAYRNRSLLLSFRYSYIGFRVARSFP